MANVFYGVGRSPKRQKYVQLLSRTACGRCNRYCLMKLSITTLLPNHPEGNLFAESPPLDGDFCWLSQSWQTQSDKDGQARKCPEQRVDAATDIARICASRFSTKTLRYPLPPAISVQYNLCCIKRLIQHWIKTAAKNLLSSGTAPIQQKIFLITKLFYFCCAKSIWNGSPTC